MGADFIVSFPGLGINDLKINRVAFNLFGLDIYWYGIIITLGIILCLILAYNESKKFDIDQEFLLDNFIVGVILALIGARLYYVAFAWDEFKDNPIDIFNTRQGGMAFYGGVIGGVLAIVIVHAVKKQNIMKFLDFIVVYVPLGQAIGRWGNFVNQEAFGVNTDSVFGMISNGTTNYLLRHPELGQNPNLPVHPTFLYESVGNLILFFILRAVRNKRKNQGLVVAIYFLGYGLLRFVIEGLRTDSLYIANTDVRVSQLLSMVLMIVGLVFLITSGMNKKKAVALAEDQEFEKAAREVSEAKLDTIYSTESSAESEIGAVEQTGETGLTDEAEQTGETNPTDETEPRDEADENEAAKVESEKSKDENAAEEDDKAAQDLTAEKSSNSDSDKDNAC